MPTISENWAELLEPGLKSIFYVNRQALAARAVRPLLFNMMSSSKAQEHFLGAGGMSDVEEYEGAIEYDDFAQLYKTTLTNTEYAKGFEVERKLVDTDQYNIINARPRALALAFERTMEKHAASVFNNAFSSSYAGGDSVSLCNDSHPAGPDHSGDTQDNAGSTALTYQAVVDTRELMRAYEDDRGELVNVMPDLILVPPELEEEANRIVNTANKPQTADYEDNFVRRSGLKALTWDYLTDANNWFMLDTMLAKEYLLWVTLTEVEFALNPVSDYQLKAQYRGYGAWSYGWSDWRWVYGHEVS